MRLAAILLTIFMLSSVEGISQCKTFTKKKCAPELAPYVQNGQLTAAVLYEGDTANVQLTFFSGQEYRLLVCADDRLGDVHYTISDIEHKILFDNEQQGLKPFDFVVESTQQLIVTVNIPKTDNTHGLAHHGCVSILVGFKEGEH